MCNGDASAFQFAENFLAILVTMDHRGAIEAGTGLRGQLSAVTSIEQSLCVERAGLLADFAGAERRISCGGCRVHAGNTRITHIMRVLVLINIPLLDEKAWKKAFLDVLVRLHGPNKGRVFSLFLHENAHLYYPYGQYMEQFIIFFCIPRLFWHRRGQNHITSSMNHHA